MPARYLSELDVSPALFRGLPRGAALRRLAAWRSFTPACRVAQLYAVTILAPTLHLHGPFTAMKATKPAKPRKLSFKEARELEGMEAQIDGVDAEITRIEGLFASPDFHRTHATQTRQLTANLAAAKENLAELYARWEELEAIKAAAEAVG
jgi:hypothetical protein